MKKIDVLIDCDPGHDDAIALLVASFSDDLNVLGVTTCSGNQTVEKTTRNANNLLNYFGRRDIPLVKGHQTPIKRPSRICPEVHGESGLDGFDFPIYENNCLQNIEAYEFIIKTVKEHKGITVVTTGPMTNLGLAFQKDPTIKDYIKEIVLMGGSTTKGNITKEAEFNILVDPEAADTCFRSGVPLRMIGLNVTRQILVTKEVVEGADIIKTRGSDLFVKLMKVFNENQRNFFGLEAAPLHDPATIISLINQNALIFEEMHVEIDTSDTEFVGKTICSKEGFKNAKVAVGVNLEEYWNEIYKHLRKCL